MPASKTFKIRKRSFPKLNGPRWEVDCGILENKRVRRFFRTKGLAEEFANAQKAALRIHGEKSISLTEDDRVLFQAARDRLAAAGATIHEAVDFYLAHHRPLRESMTLCKLLDRAVLEKELAGRSSHTVSQFTYVCRSFIRGRETTDVNNVTREHVKDWVLGNKWAPKTQKNALGYVRTLLEWAVQERYLAVNPIAGKSGYIQLAAPDPAEITALDVTQCAALWRMALTGQHGGRPHRELLGYLAIAMFARVRPHEIKRTALDRIDLRERTVVIAAHSAKTRQRRVIEVERVGIVWFRLWQRMYPGADLAPINFIKRWKALRKQAIAGPWPHDVLRHTFATYHYATHGNLARLQSQLGHSEDEETLFKHYRAVQTLGGKTVGRRMAEEFWRLTPRRVRLG